MKIFEDNSISKYYTKLDEEDYKRIISANQKLNDEVINCYMDNLSINYIDVFLYSTYFYSKLSKSGYDGVKRWNKNINIFNYKIILIPIHLTKSEHWTLVCINFDRFEINYYDSLSSLSLGNVSEIFKDIINFLKMESQNQQIQQTNFDFFKIRCVKNIPQQENGSDCGVFMCFYAFLIANGLTECFKFEQNDIIFIRKVLAIQLSTTNQRSKGIEEIKRSVINKLAKNIENFK